jgi:oligopeptide/dipeptide ABC transporter ATP-binding protein
MSEQSISDAGPALQTEALTKHFLHTKNVLSRIISGTKWIRAVDGVDLEVYPREVLALVGESGCGKTTLAKLILGLLSPTSGHVSVMGKTPVEHGSALAPLLQIVFQQGRASLNPRITIGSLLREAIRVNHIVAHEQVEDEVDNVLHMVDLSTDHKDRFAHELSGGQAQRVVIARALAMKPSILIADEPTSSLDVSIQARILNLLIRLRQELHLTMLYITHNLGSVRQISDRVAVMYLGKIVESADTEALFTRPFHPYTEALLAAVPVPDPLAERKIIVLRGETPSPVDIPSGCPFHPRCPYRQPMCETQIPEFREMNPGRWVSCHFPLS